ncbi:shikimate dehydrogenase [Nesterenkonia natronophila]|uniref:Shikimate dehydrogenase n=1 Tax=Nesterenkonia natronophila TaxID=2174932 RepID=A0A3A4F8C0_9MICC|nr:shikimate dehydrogenase [Nesterenkonia natronophila]RJN31134.1 shikimate dehydrogenase [Nesterenkonia natronophila]
MNLSAAWRRAAVLGSPISHSRSPQLHTAAYQHLGVDISYTRFEVEEETVEEFLSERAAEPNWVGWSVTMPLKSAMVPHMSSVSTRVQTLGVLNTVLVGQDAQGRRTLHGENTDVDGIVKALKQVGITGEEPAAATFAVLGSGGTAAAALAAAAELNMAEARIYARSAARAAGGSLIAERLGLPLSIRPLNALGEDLSAGLLDVVVSTLPPRAADPLASQMPTDCKSKPVLLDVAYDPWPSALAQAWSQRDWPVTSGLEMLLHQAVRQVELFTENTRNPAAVQNDADHLLMVRKMRSAAGLHEGAEALDR